MEFTLTLSDGITIGIDAVGGGTVGKAYADNDWYFEVRQNGEIVCEGSDLHSGGVPKTHRDMVAALLDFLENDAERYESVAGKAEPADGYGWNAAVAEWCFVNADALAMARHEIEESDGD